MNTDILTEANEGNQVNADNKTGVAASRQRAALFNLREKCGGLPTRRHAEKFRV